MKRNVKSNDQVISVRSFLQEQQLRRSSWPLLLEAMPRDKLVQGYAFKSNQFDVPQYRVPPKH